MRAIELEPGFAVSGQITPDDIAELSDAGFRIIVCNRPDMEVPLELSSAVIAAACEAAGLTFIDNPLGHGGLTMDAITAQGAANAGPEPVLAYCASGTRAAFLWAFAKARSGEMSTADICAALDRAGYPGSGIAGQLDAFAAGA